MLCCYLLCTFCKVTLPQNTLHIRLHVKLFCMSSALPVPSAPPPFSHAAALWRCHPSDPTMRQVSPQSSKVLRLPLIAHRPAERARISFMVSSPVDRADILTLY